VSVTEISERYVDGYARLDPVRAARSMGVGLDEPRLTDYSPDGVAALGDLLAGVERDLAAAEPVDEAERLGKLFLLEQVRGELAIVDSGERGALLSALVGPPAQVRMSFDLMPRQGEEAWERVLGRLSSVPDALAGHRTSLEHSLDDGLAATGSVVETVADQCEAWATGDGWFATYVAPYGDGAQRAALDGAARAAAAAYGELAAWLRSSYLPRARTDPGVGVDRYRTWARAGLGSALDVDDTYAWGWEELARIEGDKRAECDRIAPGASFDEVRELLSTDPARCIDGLDAYRAWLQEVSDAATATLDGWQFDIPEPLRRCDIGIPPEGSAAAPYYTPPSEDLSQPGRTWFPALGRTRFPTWDEVTTAYHEAVPGHHLQLGTTRLVPLVRAHRLGFQNAHGEGWALYAERLMDELGQFATPDTRLGFLASQAFRAVRVVVDIGLHTGRTIPDGWPGAGSAWTVELAEEHLRQAGGLTEAFARSEVQRYLSWPAQAITYKVGERSWLAGREAAREAAGDEFDLKAWHARALALGALGLDDLERELGAC
jgi:uncharacterized protein (DUF885 family)